MKRYVTAIFTIAGMLLWIVAPMAEASVTGTFSVAITTPNATSTDIVFPDLSGGTASTSATSISSAFAAVSSATSADRTLNIGSTTVSFSAGASAAAAASTTAAAINADPSNPYTASVVSTNEVELTAKASGSAGNGPVLASDLSYNGTAEVVVFTPANVTAGETFRATINGTDYDYAATASSTVATVVAGLAPLMDANAAVSCTQDGTAITCTAVSPGTAFTASATVFSSPLVLSPISISSNGSSTLCAKAGDTVTLNFSSNMTLGTSTTVTINGTPATLNSLGNNMYSASTTLNASTTEGVVAFLISPYDSSNVAASTSASTTDHTSVTFDNTAPTITLSGNAVMNIAFGSTFTDPGATTTDNIGPVTATTTGRVNTLSPGTYTLTYTATDCAGNSASTTRTVIVGAAPQMGGHSGGGGGSSFPPSTFGQLVSAIAQSLAPITTGPAVPSVVRQVLGATSVRFAFNLKRGISSDVIAELQQKLKDLGFYTGPITGYFGQLTERGVMKFQKAHKIKATGFVGPLTRDELNNS